MGRRLSAPRIAYQLVFVRRVVVWPAVIWLLRIWKIHIGQSQVKRGWRSVVLFQHEQLALAAYHAGERAPVDRAGPVPVERGEVLGRRVALVAGGAARRGPAAGLAAGAGARGLPRARPPPPAPPAAGAAGRGSPRGAEGRGGEGRRGEE